MELKTRRLQTRLITAMKRLRSADAQVAELAEQVDKTNMEDNEVKVTHEALSEVMKGWKGVAKVGDNCPELLMVVPCSLKDHRPWRERCTSTVWVKR